LTRAGDGERGYANYRCRGRHGAGVCPEPARLSVPRADGYVERAFLEWLADEGIGVEAADKVESVAAAVGAVEATKAELAEYRDANLITVIGRETYLQGLEQRQAALDATRLELNDAQRATVALPLGPRALMDVWPDLDRRGKANDPRRGDLTSLLFVGLIYPAVPRSVIGRTSSGAARLPSPSRAEEHGPAAAEVEATRAPGDALS
jgi:hypothetical protein